MSCGVLGFGVYFRCRFACVVMIWRLDLRVICCRWVVVKFVGNCGFLVVCWFVMLVVGCSFWFVCVGWCLRWKLVVGWWGGLLIDLWWSAVLGCGGLLLSWLTIFRFPGGLRLGLL